MMIIVDIETTGIDPKKCSILSIGAVNFYDPNDFFYGECQIWQGAEINKDSLKIAGFDEFEIVDPKKQTPKDLVVKFLNWLAEKDNQTIAGQNPRFDLDFLAAQIKRSNLGHKLGFRTVDLHSVLYAKLLEKDLIIPLNFNRTSINLDWILDFVGLNKRRGSHNALEDAKLEAEAFSRIIFNKGLLDEYKKFKLKI